MERFTSDYLFALFFFFFVLLFFLFFFCLNVLFFTEPPNLSNPNVSNNFGRSLGFGGSLGSKLLNLYASAIAFVMRFSELFGLLTPASRF